MTSSRVQLARVELGHDAALAHHDDPVRRGQGLTDLGGHVEDGQSTLGLAEEQREDLTLRADVDPAGRLVEQDHLGIGEQHLADHDLLLVAAGQRGDQRLRACCLHLHVGDHLADLLSLELAIDEAPLHPGLQTGQCHVGAHRHHLDEAVTLSVLGHQAHARVDPLLDGEVRDVLARQQYPAAGEGVSSGQRLHQLRPTRTHQPVEADHLTLPDVQRQVVHRHPPGLRLGDGDPLNRQGHAPVVTRFVTEVVVGLPTHHLPHHPGQVDVGGVLGRHQVTVAEDHGVVRDLDRLLQVVGDVDDGHSVGGQVPDHLEQHLDLAGAQRRGRLVHDQDPGVGGQGASDLDDLLLSDPQVLDKRARSDRLLQPLHQLPGDLALGGVVDGAGSLPQLPTEEDVVAHTQVRRQVELLVDDRDTEIHRLVRRVELDPLSVQLQVAVRRGGHPGHDLHQGRLAGAVLSEQHRHLAPAYIEVDTLERAGDPVSLADVDRAEDDLTGIPLRRRHGFVDDASHQFTSMVMGWTFTGFGFGCGAPLFCTEIAPTTVTSLPFSEAGSGTDSCTDCCISFFSSSPTYW